MEINTHIHYSDMTSDYETESGEMTLNANMYFETKGASPSEKAKVKEILDRYYKDIRSEIFAIKRFS